MYARLPGKERPLATPPYQTAPGTGVVVIKGQIPLGLEENWSTIEKNVVTDFCSQASEPESGGTLLACQPANSSGSSKTLFQNGLLA